MKRVIFLLTAIMVSVSAMAFDFAGKTFKAKRTENGVTLTATAKFMSGGRLSMTFTATGMKSQSDPNMHWEEAGDWLNVVDSTGDLSVWAIKEDEDGVYLVMLDQNGYPYLEFHQVKTAPKTTGKATGKSTKPRKRK